MGMQAASGTFTPDGNYLAVGMRNGGIKVMQFHPQTMQVRQVGLTDCLIPPILCMHT